MNQLDKLEIEDFIRKHKEDLNGSFPNDSHENKFLVRLSRRFRKIISIVPYLVRVFVITIIIFILSVWVWNRYLREDRHEITLKQKIENLITIKK